MRKRNDLRAAIVYEYTQSSCKDILPYGGFTALGTGHMTMSGMSIFSGLQYDSIWAAIKDSYRMVL